jgi:hypothetical protein
LVDSRASLRHRRDSPEPARLYLRQLLRAQGSICVPQRPRRARAAASGMVPGSGRMARRYGGVHRESREGRFPVVRFWGPTGSRHAGGHHPCSSSYAKRPPLVANPRIRASAPRPDSTAQPYPTGFRAHDRFERPVSRFQYG